MAENLTPEQRAKNIKMVTAYLYGIAGIMAVIGILCFAKPDMVRTVLDFDNATLKIFGGGLFAMALFDVVFFAPLLKGQDTK